MNPNKALLSLSQAFLEEYPEKRTQGRYLDEIANNLTGREIGMDHPLTRTAKGIATRFEQMVDQEEKWEHLREILLSIQEEDLDSVSLLGISQSLAD